MNIFKNGFKLCGSLIIAAIISVFLCFSMNVIISAMFTSEIGYKAFVYETQESTEPIAQYEYYYTDKNGDGKDDGTDTKMQEYEDKDYIVTTVKQRSTLTGAGKAIFLISTQILSMIMIVAFASNSPYKQGFKDANLVKIGHTKRDVLKGLKIGLIGNIPFFAITILMIILATGTAPAFRTVWYAFLSGHFYSIIMWITGGVLTVGEISTVQYVWLVLVQFTVPVISCVAYILGFKEINLAEKLVYKKEVE